MCGDIVKVTPSSKVVGDLAQFLVANKLSYQEVVEKADTLDFPGSVIEYFQGYLGQPTGGFPEPLRTKIIRDKPRIDGRPGADMAPYDFDATKKKLSDKYGGEISQCDVLSYALYPKVYEEFRDFQEKYGDLSVVPTRHFLGKPKVGEEVHIPIEAGKTLILKLVAVSPADPETGIKDILCKQGHRSLFPYPASFQLTNLRSGVCSRDERRAACGAGRGPQCGGRARQAREGDVGPWIDRLAHVGRRRRGPRARRPGG